MNIYSQKILLFISVILFAFFLIVYADKDGYEGDDLNSAVPAMHLEEMRAGLIEDYKYDWQPLSYQLSSALFKVSNTPKSMFLMSPIAIAISILLLFLLVNHLYGTNLLVFACLLLMMPEFIYTGLYYNSHAPASLFYILAICSLLTINEHSNLIYRSILIGVFSALAILFRLDYVLAFPILLALLHIKTNTLKYASILAVSAGLVGVLALAFDVVSLSGAIQIYQESSQEIAEKSSSGGWDRMTKIMVLTTLFSPAGWIYFIVGGFFYIQVSRLRRYSAVLILIALIPMLYPFKDLLSVKYALPFLIWLLIFGAYLFKEMQAHQTKYRRIASACLLLSVFFSVVYINVSREKPFVAMSVESGRIIGTHDGDRSWGGHLWAFTKVQATNHLSEGYVKAKKILEDINTSNGTFVIVGKQNVFDRSSTGWRYIQLFLAEQKGVSAEVVGINHIRMHDGRFDVHFCDKVSCLNAQALENKNLTIIHPDFARFQ